MTVSRRDELSRLATPGPVPEVPRAGGDEREESSTQECKGDVDSLITTLLVLG